MKLVAWISRALERIDAARGIEPHLDPAANPVVLVHGIHSSSADMARMARQLRAAGFEVFTPDLTPNCGRGGIDELAAKLAAYIDGVVPGRRFDLVGFSMGGLIGRFYMQRLGGAARVDRFITVAAPHRGTLVALLNPHRGGIHMRPRSEFLRELESDEEKLRGVRFTSIYTPLDFVIIPARSSIMPHARNVRVWTLLHPVLILGLRGIRAVIAALREPLESAVKAQPSPSQSGQSERG